MSPCHHPSTRTTVPDWANWLSHCSGHSWETSGLCGELVDRVAVSMGEVTAHPQACCTGWGPGQLALSWGALSGPISLMMAVWGTELQGPFLSSFGCC